MNKHRFRSIGQRAAVLLLLVGVPLLLVQFGLWIWHPMFYNQFIMHDGLPFFHWWVEAPTCDERGNLAKADYHRNLLVVFLVAETRVASSQFCFPRSVQGGVAFPSQLEADNKIEFVVPDSTNKLFVFGGDGTRTDFPLAAGEAQRIYRLTKPQPPDLARLVERVYAEKHSPEDSARLREAITTLRAKASKASKAGPVEKNGKQPP